MEIRQIECFLALANELHFTRAAARVHLAQPSFSQQIKRLERELGVQLVERANRPVSLTPAGQLFSREARRGIDYLARAANAAGELGRGSKKPLVLSYVLAAGQQVIPQVVNFLSSGTTPRLLELWTEEQILRVQSGEVDLAFVFGVPSSPELESSLVANEQFVAVVPKNDKLANEEHVRFGDLKGRACVMFRRQRSPVVYDALMAAASCAKVELSVAHEIDAPSAVGLLTNSGHNIGIASMARAAQFEGSGLVVRPLVEPKVSVGIFAVWNSAFADTGASQVLASLTAV